MNIRPGKGVNVNSLVMGVNGDGGERRGLKVGAFFLGPGVTEDHHHSRREFGRMSSSPEVMALICHVFKRETLTHSRKKKKKKC